MIFRGLDRNGLISSWPVKLIAGDVQIMALGCCILLFVLIHIYFVWNEKAGLDLLDIPLDGNGSQRKESEQKRKERNLMGIDTEQPGRWRHMVFLSQRHRASLVRGTAYVLRNCTTSLINSIPSQISPTTVLTCKAVPHCVYLHFLTSIEE